MTREEKRKFMLQVKDETETTAGKADLYYVICFWMSPIIDSVDHRRAYFDDFSEAISFQTRMIQQYKNMKYFIASNLSSGDTDGGLLDD